MKKNTSSLLFVVILIFMLASCGQSEIVQKDEAEKQQEEPKMTAHELYDKTIEVNDEIESYISVMELDQKLYSGKTRTYHNEMHSEITMTSEPKATYSKIDFDMMGDSVDIDIYSTDDGFYTYYADDDFWGKFDKEDGRAALSELNIGDPFEDLKNIKDLIKEFSVKEEEDKYILTINGDSSEQFEGILKQLIAEIPADDRLFETDEAAWDFVIKHVKINNISYEIIIEKDSYYLLEMDMKMDMEVPNGFGTYRVEQTVNSNYSKYNSVDEIVVPQEGIDSAVDMVFES